MTEPRAENQPVRAAQAVVLLAALAGLLVYGGVVLPDAELRYRHCSADPLRYDGAHVLLNSAELQEVGEGYFCVADEGSRRLRVEGSIGDCRPGDHISLDTVFSADGRLTLARYYRHRLRPLKIGVSLLALLVFLCYWVRRYRWRWRGCYFVER